MQSTNRGYTPTTGDVIINHGGHDMSNSNYVKVEDSSTSRQAIATFTNVFGLDRSRQPRFDFICENIADVYAKSGVLAEAQLPSSKGLKMVFRAKEIWEETDSHGDLADYQFPVTMTISLTVPTAAFALTGVETTLLDLYDESIGTLRANFNALSRGIVDVKNVSV